MMFLGTLRVLMSSLESSWRILAHSNPKTDSKTNPKMVPKWTQNQTRNCSICGPLFENFLASCWGHFGAKISTADTARDLKTMVLQLGNYIFVKNVMIFM